MTSVDINGRFLTQAITGVQRCAMELVQALDQQLTSDLALRSRYRVRLMAPPQHEQPVKLSHIPTVPVGRLRGQAWEQFELPNYSRGNVLVNLCNTAPLARPGIVTIYDASVFVVPEAYTPAFRAWYRVLFPLLGRRSLRVVTVSRFSQGELARRVGIPAGKIDVIPLGAEHILRAPADPSILARIGVDPHCFILAVGSRSPHKNFGAVTSAVARLGPDRLPLVVAGGANSRIFARSATPDGAIHVGYVSDRELRALYENAACFVFPSLYEGFGLPALEAMACGCPAVVARAGSLPEVCGDAVLYCDPRDPDQIASRIRLLLQEPGRRQELRDRGTARARSFSWGLASTALLRIIDSVQPV
jgi:glycosyltransferase involved in cell wall biosynthesis